MDSVVEADMCQLLAPKLAIFQVLESEWMMCSYFLLKFLKKWAETIMCAQL